MLIVQFYEHLPHFRFKIDFVKFFSSIIEDFEILLNIIALDNLPGFIEKSKDNRLEGKFISKMLLIYHKIN